ncbi:MAG: hypothetical protein WBE48_09580, partial [Xanthobacteraceae bacterium]
AAQAYHAARHNARGNGNAVIGPQSGHGSGFLKPCFSPCWRQSRLGFPALHDLRPVRPTASAAAQWGAPTPFIAGEALLARWVAQRPATAFAYE